MALQRFCQDCIQKHDCKKIYEQLGDSSGPSIAIKAILAFLLPLMVFIVSLAVFERVLAGVINTEQMQTFISFVLALLVTFMCILITRVVKE
ncbi:MAG: hypothetical protein A2168_06400 [Planctomycetes bacterium RBG_13_50_24]|nr:MAG: hypothetical protein A2168_06400 [Planctomycetes bacterium RBG_13_50_24]